MDSLIGKVFRNKKDEEFSIIEYFNRQNITVKFSDGTIVNNKSLGNIKVGSVKNPNFPIIFSIGFLGQGKYLPKDSYKIYQTWSDIFQRCYSKRFHKLSQTYKDCTVHPEWHNFQNFARWYEENYIENFHLDKDILFKGNKIYGPDTCCFVPIELNGSFTKRNSCRGIFPIGVMVENKKFLSLCNINKIQERLGLYNTPEEAFFAYKTAKELEIKRLADKYKSQITPEVYSAMYNYQVEITD